jgi:L-alanine-DL-glutamate epimerase-like enolase superfamily enzyme
MSGEITHSSGAQIANISYRAMDIPLSTPFRFATNILHSLPYAWVRMETYDGTVGFGEAPTYWDPTGETQYAAIGAFKLWENELYRHSVFGVAEIRTLMEDKARGAYAARCAIESALLDAQGQILEIPAANLLLGEGQQLRNVRQNAIIGLPDLASGTDNRYDEVIEKVAAGARVIKFKSSADTYDADKQLIRRVGQLPDTPLTMFVDANQSWGDADTALSRAIELSELGVQWLEQPIKEADTEGQQRLVAASPIPIMLDEGVLDYMSLKKEILLGTLDYANLKLAKAGGPYSAMDFIKIAKESGIRYSIGSMVESGLGMLANYAVAQASDPLTCDFEAYFTVRDGLDVGFERDGDLLVRNNNSRHGLGYDRAQMEQAFANGKEIN